MQKGFTLIEMLVAVALFLIVAVSSISLLMVLLRSQQKTVFIQTNQDNVRFAIESMAREMRTGQEYSQGTGLCTSLPDPIADPESCFQFTNARSDTVVYKLSSGVTDCNSAGRCVAKLDSSISSSDFQPITAPEVDVSSLKFYLAGEVPRDAFQPHVTILLRAVTPGTDPDQSRLDVQTTVTMLQLD